MYSILHIVNFMLSVSDAVRQILKNQPFVEECLQKGILNLSQYAIVIHKQVEDITFKSVTQGSIVTALSRMQGEIHTKFEIDFKVNDLSLKFPLSELVFPMHQAATAKTSEIYKSFSKFQNHFLNIIAGNTEITVFVNSRYEQDLLGLFQPLKPINVTRDLAGVSLKFSEDYLEVRGIIYEVLKSLVWEGINLNEVISTYTEITLIINRKDANRAFEVLSGKFLS